MVEGADAGAVAPVASGGEVMLDKFVLGDIVSSRFKVGADGTVDAEGNLFYAHHGSSNIGKVTYLMTEVAILYYCSCYQATLTQSNDVDITFTKHGMFLYLFTVAFCLFLHA